MPQLDEDEPADARQLAIKISAEFVTRLFQQVGKDTPEGFALSRALGFNDGREQIRAARELGCSREWLRKLENRTKLSLGAFTSRDAHRKSLR